MSEVDERLSEGRQALATMDPPADLWARVIERSGNGDAVVYDLARAHHQRRSGRLLAVVAVAALLAVVAAAVLRVDDQPLETVPATDMPEVPAPGTVVSGHGCPFGIAGDPIVMETGPVDPDAPRFDPEGGQNIAHTVLGSQVAEVRVPGFDLSAADGWRMEDIQLDRGTARVWLNGPPSGEQGKPFVQVRWFPGSQNPCGSFTVTVDGGTESANREVAIDLAERIVLPGEHGDLDLPGAEGGPVAGLELAGTDWVIADTSNGAPGGVTMSFGDTTVTWDNGCATVTADHDLDRDDGFLTLANPTSTSPGCTPPTIPEARSQPWPVIDAVMSVDRIPVAYVLDRAPSAEIAVTGLLQLGDHPEGSYLILAPA
jgi:hypothetical protein